MIMNKFPKLCMHVSSMVTGYMLGDKQTNMQHFGELTSSIDPRLWDRILVGMTVGIRQEKYIQELANFQLQGWSSHA